jgi:hypothetical protein
MLAVEKSSQKMLASFLIVKIPTMTYQVKIRPI